MVFIRVKGNMLLHLFVVVREQEILIVVRASFNRFRM